MSGVCIEYPDTPTIPLSKEQDICNLEECLVGINGITVQYNTNSKKTEIGGILGSLATYKEEVFNTIEGNSSITLAITPISAWGVFVYRNGIRQEEGNEYTRTGSTIYFTTSFTKSKNALFSEQIQVGYYHN